MIEEMKNTREELDISTTLEPEKSRIEYFLKQYNSMKYNFMQKNLVDIKEIIKKKLDKKKEELNKMKYDPTINELISEGLFEMQEKLTSLVENLDGSNIFSYSTISQMNFKEVKFNIDTITKVIEKKLGDFAENFEKKIDTLQVKLKNVDFNQTDLQKSELQVACNNSEYEFDMADSIKHYQPYLNDVKEKITIKENQSVALPEKVPKRANNKIKKIKFNRFSSKVLFNWLKQNKDEPHPSGVELICLATKARLSEKQLMHWLNHFHDKKSNKKIDLAFQLKKFEFRNPKSEGQKRLKGKAFSV